MIVQPTADLPAPAPPGTGSDVDHPAWQLPPMSARMVLASARRHALPEPDRVDFAARCPACGTDACWTEERDDTRVRIGIDCDCD